MTEAEWLACDDLPEMLGLLKARASDRNARTFAVDCCRRLWHRLDDERSQRAVEAVEAFADGLISVERLIQAREEAFAALDVDHEGPAAGCSSHGSRPTSPCSADCQRRRK